MKLNEIYGDQTTIKMVQPTKNQARDPGNMKNLLGWGAYGYVKNNPIDPHLIAKRSIASKSLPTDPYYIYISYVLKHNLMDENIHFPRIYNITIIPTHHNNVTGGKQHYRIDMERLISVDDTSQEEMRALVEYTFNEDTPYYTLYIKEKTASPKTSVAVLYTKIIAAMGAYYIGSVDESIFKDKTLVSAMNILRKIKDKDYEYHGTIRHLFYDTKRENYLLRRTPLGLQIVFSDPLS